MGLRSGVMGAWGQGLGHGVEVYGMGRGLGHSVKV